MEQDSELLEKNFQEDSPEILSLKEKWKMEQLELKHKLITTDELTFDVGENNENSSLKYVGGVDISFIKNNIEDACASFVISDAKIDITLYLPINWKEVPFLLKLIEELRSTKPDIIPQVIFVDGNGYLHPRGFGLACHLGVLCGIPTIGIGKTFLTVDGITWEKEKLLEKQLCKGGDTLELVGDSGTIWGALLRSTDSSSKPIFVSLGHKISLTTSLWLTKKCCLYRIPEPVRKADLMSREFIRNNPI